MGGLRVIVCGGRDYHDREAVFRSLDHVHLSVPIAIVVEGGADGADSLAREWAQARGVAVEEHPADWTTHGRMAGLLRNGQMARAGADLCIAFPGGSGTAHMIVQAGRRRIRVWRPIK